MCPDLSDYEAYLIDERNDPVALGIATQKVIDCRCDGGAQHCPNPAGEVTSAARRVWAVAQDQAVYSLRGLGELVRRLSVLPGQRSVVFISTGFISDAQLQTISEVIDRAVRVGVVVNALDARGLYLVIPGGDASQPGSNLNGASAGQLTQIQMQAMQQDSDVLAEVADGTGGTFFHNNNDLDAGIRETGGLPQFSYVLGFSPGKLKFDGKYHHLTVQLAGEAKRRGLMVQARQVYFAPRNAPSPEQAEHQELGAAVFFREEINKSRVNIGTRFFKSSSMEAQVSVRVHLDPQWLTFRKNSERRLDEVNFTTAIFDNNGNYLDGTKKTIQMQLPEASLEKVRSAGLSAESSFKVPLGTYLVREVVRDDGGLISSRSSTLEIPY